MAKLPSAGGGLSPSSRPTLAIFGGSFDPVHNGHLFVASEVVRAELAEEVMFVPARRPPHKTDRRLSAAADRLSMLNAALAPFPEFSCSDIELTREDGLSYTFDTLETLNQAFPERELLFLLGMDNLVSLHTWHRAPELVQKYRLIVYPRGRVVTPSFAELAGHFGDRHARRLLAAVINLQLIPVRGSDIRADCALGRNLAGRIPESVLGYIRDHGLYASRP